ncbi:MAG: tRNA lysidine(34) synthetase TilS, partial [Tenericutes bacterium]
MRYDFFVKVAKKYDAKKVLIAHHKDDFVETAMMQQVTGREPSYFGIRKRSNYGDLQVYRP